MRVSDMGRDEASEAGGRVPSWRQVGASKMTRGQLLTHKDSNGTCIHLMASESAV
jgi:hypothetical protein